MCQSTSKQHVTKHYSDIVVKQMSKASAIFCSLKDELLPFLNVLGVAVWPHPSHFSDWDLWMLVHVKDNRKTFVIYLSSKPIY